MTTPLPQLKMRRPSLDGLGDAPVVPSGYTLRLARLEEAAAVARVLALSFEDPSWDAEKVRRELLENAFVDCTFVIEHSSGIVATASAQLPREDGDLTGWLHWVGADPAHRGKQLGHILCDTVLRRHVELGFIGGSLSTEDFRLPAIETYLRLGFEPWHTDDSHSERWRAIFAKLGR